jgi:hypothetical protein
VGDGSINYALGVVDLSVGSFDPLGIGEPLSAHKATFLQDGANSLLAYKTRTVHVNDWFDAPMKTPAASGTNLIWTCWVPFFGHRQFGFEGHRKLLARIRGSSDVGDDTVYRLVSTHNPVANVAYADIPSKNEVTFTVNGLAESMSGVLELMPLITPGGIYGLHGTWLSVWATVPSATYGMSYLTVYEDVI